MLDAARHHDAFPRLERDDMVPKLDAKTAAPHHEELVLVIVMVPTEFALHFHQLDLLAVQRSNRLRPLVFVE